jgi:GMP synthase (glutamine-hydrolysing)
VRPIALVQNDPTETFGVATSELHETGVGFRAFDATNPGAPRPRLDEVSGIVMFGGSMNVDETDEHPFLKENRDLTREAVERGVPYLGICLGAQLLARALDRPVVRAPVMEFGFEPVHPTAAGSHDRLLAHYEQGDMVFHWHQDTVELPEGAVLLATGDEVHTQAFRVGELAWGVQFHFEIDGPEIELWLDDASRFIELEEVWGKSPARVREEAARHLARHETQGRAVFRRFAEVVRSEDAG